MKADVSLCLIRDTAILIAIATKNLRVRVYGLDIFFLLLFGQIMIHALLSNARSYRCSFAKLQICMEISHL